MSLEVPPTSSPGSIEQRRPAVRRRRRPRVALGLATGMVFLGLGISHWWGVRLPAFLESWPAPDTGFEPWRRLGVGVEYARASLSQPRPVKCHALRIDLQNPAVQVVVPRGRGDGEGVAQALLPTSWLRRHGLIVAMNATPFTPYQIPPFVRTHLQGLAVSAGEQWSPPVPNLDSFVLRPDGQPALVPAMTNTGPVAEGVGGFLIVLSEGKVRDETLEVDSATFVGFSADHRWLYWLVADGGQPGYSEGVTPREGGVLMQQLGAANALRLDGGGSSALVASDGWFGARLLNRPRSPIYAGICRPVGNVLGVRLRSSGP